jgi:ribosomal protein S13
MMPRTALLLTLCLASAPAAATTIFKCKDENGKIYYSQSFDREKCSGGGAELNDRGIAVREIERRKTAAELAAEKAAAEAAAEAQRLRDAQQQADRVLLMSYATEEDLARSNRQELEVIESSVQAGRLQMARHEQHLADLLAQAADVERSGQSIPADLTTRIDTVRDLIEEQRAFITRKLAQQAQSNLEFTMRLIRFREMRARQEALIRGDAET